MTARVLVVDDILANVKLLEARLSAEYLEVLTASSGMEALQLLERERVDVILLDVMMPGLDGFETCRRIKGSANTAHIPVVMVTALDQPCDKVQGLEAGADDFLTKPVDDIALVTRVKNLARLKTLHDEMMLRAVTNTRFGIAPVHVDWAGSEKGRIMLVDDNKRSARRVFEVLNTAHEVDVEPDFQAAPARLCEQNFDLLIVNLRLERGDGLRLCSHMRSLERTRHLPIVVLVEPGDEARLLRALDMGVNDYLMRPIDRNELLARVRTQVRRKRNSDFLRGQLRESVELALVDPLTGLYNRRYMETHLRLLSEQSRSEGSPLSILVADIDHFKSINDTHGHDAGDAVLREVAARLRRNTRGVDLVCRLGGEEFVIVMPDTDGPAAMQVAERLRACVAAEPFRIAASTQICVTASVGVATLDKEEDTPEILFKRADNALYAAKREGRNRVVSTAA
jgi:two-component system cell cycle response regulator